MEVNATEEIQHGIPIMIGLLQLDGLGRLAEEVALG